MASQKLCVKVATTDFDKASLFNSFFESVYSQPNFPIDVNNFQPCTQKGTLDIINITDMDVYTALINLYTTKACGIDGIGPKVLRFCALPLYPIIYHLFSIILCLWYCVLPLEWKLHCIVLIHKSGDRSLVSNYRPNSLLCNPRKACIR